jgi:2-keto-4-pentenoate hydratase/2-oxohepta-3-ene-1,7-dioic acid hydratase in catechol pathway
LRIVSYRFASDDKSWRSGVTSGDRLVDGAAVGWPESVREVLERGPAFVARGLTAVAAAVEAGDSVATADVELGPPVPDPSKIVCVGLNYAAHAAEAGRSAPEAPELFAKFPNSLIGPQARVVAPAMTDQIDYEAELAVIIGEQCHGVTVDRALDFVAGYAVFNDVSARDLQMASSQWTAGKAIDTFGPFGPGITPRSEVPDVQSLAIRTWVNGRLLQDGHTSDMLIPVAEIVSYVSSIMTLEPGDVIATGTPAGVGMAQRPVVFLRPGDTVEVEIEGLGRLVNPVVGPLAS